MYIETMAQLNTAVTALSSAKYICFDTETTGLNYYTDKVLLAQFYNPDNKDTFVVNCTKVDPINILKLLSNKNVITIAHNLTFDYCMIKAQYGIDIAKPYCSMIAEQLITAGYDYKAGLKDTLERRLNVPIDKTLQRSFINADIVDFNPNVDQIEYAAKDVRCLFDLRIQQIVLLKEKNLMRVMGLEMKALSQFVNMTLNGIYLDKDLHNQVMGKYKSDVAFYGPLATSMLDELYQGAAEPEYLEALDKKIELSDQIIQLNALIKDTKKYSGSMFDANPVDLSQYEHDLIELRKQRDAIHPIQPKTVNLNSGDQVKKALAAAGISLPDTQAKTIQDYKHKHPALDALALYNESKKYTTTYGDSLQALISPVTGRIHPDFRQLGANTGRTSCTNPNAQNAPKDIRTCFTAAPGYLLCLADFSAIQLRIAAALSKDPAMLQAFNAGLDLHNMTTQATWPELFPTYESVDKHRDEKYRNPAKTLNFAAIFGATPEGLYARGKIESVEIGKKVMKGIQKAYPTMWQWIKDQGNLALEQGYVESASGRRKQFSIPARPRGYDKAYQSRISSIQREAGNMPIQATEADIAKQALVYVGEALAGYKNVKLVNFVHDEIVIEAPEDQAEYWLAVLIDCMQRAGKMFIDSVEISAEGKVSRQWQK